MEPKNVRFLMDQVQRLNNELFWYQSQDHFNKDPHIPVMTWLTEESLISPLLVEYDRKIQQKDGQIQSISAEFSQLKEELSKVIQENDDLREKLCNLKELEVDSLPNILIETDADLKAVENMKKQLVLVSKEKEKVMEMYQESMKQVKHLTTELQNAKSSQRWDLIEQQTSQVKNEYLNSMQNIVAEIEPLQNKLKEKESELVQLKIENNTLQSFTEELQRKCKWKEQELAELRKKESSFSVENDEMKIQVASLKHELKTKNQESEQIHLKNSELEKWVLIQQDKSSKLEENLHEILEDKKNAQQIVENAVLEKDLVKELCQQKQDEVNHLQEMVEELMKEAGMATRKEVDEVKLQYNNRISKLNEKVHYLELECSEKDATLERSLRDKKSAEMELENVRKDCLSETKKCNEIKEQLGQRLTNAQQSRDTAMRNLEKFRHQLERDEKNNKQKSELLNAQIDQLKDQVSCLNDQNSQLSDSKLQLIQEVNDLKAQVLKANNERDEIQRTMNKKISLMKEQINTHTQDYEVKLQNCEDVNQGVLVEMKKLLNTQQLVSARWKEEFTTISNKSEEKQAQLRSELSRYKSRNSELKGLLRESQMKMSETSQLMKEYCAKIQRMECQLKAAQQNTMEVNRKLSYLQMKHRDLSNENRLLREETHLNGSNNATRNQSSDSPCIIDQLSNQHNEQEEEDGLFSER